MEPLKSPLPSCMRSIFDQLPGQFNDLTTTEQASLTEAVKVLFGVSNTRLLRMLIWQANEPKSKADQLADTAHKYIKEHKSQILKTEFDYVAVGYTDFPPEHPPRIIFATTLEELLAKFVDQKLTEYYSYTFCVMSLSEVNAILH